MRNGNRVRLGGPKQRGVLAVLLLEANRVVSVDRLIDELYGDLAPATAATQIQIQVSQLRKLLEPGRSAREPGSILETRAPGYLLRVEPDQLDFLVFERLVQEGARALDGGEMRLAESRLGEALALWRGEPLADLAYESFAQSAIGRLEELRLAAVEKRIEAALGLGAHAELVSELDVLVTEHPLREGLRGELMRALYGSGRQGEALLVYHATRRLLDAELGINPSPALTDLAARILRHDPTLEPRVRTRAPTAAADTAANPYKGLRAFDEADAADFFGREALTRRLLERLTASRFVAVVGPSGSGKSSVVRAGLVPAVRARPASSALHIAIVTPGAAPAEALQAALLTMSREPPTRILERLNHDERGLALAVDAALPRDAELVLVVDQLEELFIMVGDEQLRARFLSLLEHAATDPHSRVRVVVTLRADFYDRPLLHRGFATLLRDAVEMVPPLSPDELERAVAGPSDRIGLALEPGLLGQIIADVVDEPGALPLLQYALTELFERRSGGMLTREAYASIGGVTGALARRAEQLYAALGERGQAAAEQLLLHLVTVGEFAEAGRPVARAELASLEVDQAALANALEAFGAARLLSFDRDARTAAPTVGIAHEALLRAWERLAGWIEEAREDLRLHRLLSGAASEWLDAQRDASFLLRGSRLIHFETWAGESRLARTLLEREYLDASVEARVAEEEATEEQRVRERSLERRSVKRLRALVAVLAAAALTAALLTALAFSERAHARHQANIAQARELSAAADANLDVDPGLSMLLGIQAVERARRLGGAVLSEAENALHRAIQASREVRTLVNPATAAVAWSPGGRLIVTAGASGISSREVTGVVVWDALTGRVVRVLHGHATSVHDAAFSPDGRLLATSDDTATTIVWDVRSGRRLFTLRNRDGARGFAGVRFSHDGSLLATEDWAGNLRLWRVASRTLVRTIRTPFGLCDLSFTPDGRRIAAGDCFGTEAHVWSVTTGRQLLSLRGHTDVVFSAKFSPDGRRIATASSDGTARVWDARTGRLLVTMIGHTNWVQALVWSPDSRTIATGGIDGTARLWDARSGRQLLVLHGHKGVIDDLEFSPDGRRLVTGSDDGTARIWDVSVAGSRDLSTFAADAGGVATIRFSPDGTELLSAGARDGDVKVWNATRWSLVRSYRIGGELDDAAFTPDGRELVSAGSSVVLTNLSSGRPVWTLPPRGWIQSVAVSPDGRLVAAGLAATDKGSGLVTTWDARTGRRLGRFGHPSSFLSVAYRLAFSPDGTLLAAARWDGFTQLWNVASGRRQATLQNGRIRVQSVAFNPSGTLLATGGWDGKAKLWNISSGRLVRTFVGHIGTVQDVAFSPDGTLLATAGDDTTARLWDIKTGRDVLTLTGHSFGLTAVGFSRDGTSLVTASGDGTVRAYALGINRLLALAQSRLTRTWTSDECRTYLPGGACPRGRHSPRADGRLGSASAARDQPEQRLRGRNR